MPNIISNIIVAALGMCLCLHAQTKVNLAKQATPRSTSGTFAAMPIVCGPGDQYFAQDQPIGQQTYYCTQGKTWQQFLSLGSSGALMMSGGSLDINPIVMPRLMSYNIWTGLNVFQGFTLKPTSTDPGCSAMGRMWLSNTGRLSVCIADSNGNMQWQVVQLTPLASIKH